MSDTTTLPEFAPVDLLAERYGVSTRTIWRWIATGRLDAVHFTASTVRVPRASIEALEAQAAQEAA